MEEGKKTRGRQRIPMQRIEKAGDRFATFSKRRKGFYKKATELCWLSGCDIGIVLTSPTGKLFSYFNPSPESIARRLFNRTENAGGEISLAVDGHSRRQVNELYEMMDGVEARMEGLNQRSKVLDQSIPSNTWWDTPVDEFSLEDVERCQAFLAEMQTQVSARFDALNNGGAGSSSSIAAQQQNPALFTPLLPSNAPIL
ncbi:PREDICTED: agamous-like MADS-box protein AGL61 [Ipomoea nil]|uniref:agamous-like MADS-box protein AGL61 n=1 Tax=Ipomoea nil TaxID=35883 RepID=UPI00090189E6|nr:PREDICTED: agamous-like MADS-box protein AGL61 [Ipomoea nil]